MIGHFIARYRKVHLSKRLQKPVVVEVHRCCHKRHQPDRLIANHQSLRGKWSNRLRMEIATRGQTDPQPGRQGDVFGSIDQAFGEHRQVAQVPQFRRQKGIAQLEPAEQRHPHIQRYISIKKRLLKAHHVAMQINRS